MVAGDDTQVLYLAGFGRSGSTIFGSVLGQVDGWFHGGEIRNLWNDGWLSNYRCGCGLPFWSCQVWSAVAAEIQSSLPGIKAEEVVGWRDDVARTRQLPRLSVPMLRRRLLLRSRPLREVLGATYAAIKRVTDARVIIDSTMSPMYGRLLAETPGIDISVVHLIRDPRAVAFSWQKRSMQDAADGVAMRRDSVTTSALKWTVENLASERLASAPVKAYMRVTYEDFTSHPAATVERVARTVSSATSLPEWEGSSLRIAQGHAVWGNPSRFHSGQLAIRRDDRWRSEMPVRQKTAVGLLSGAVMRRYGYR